jgi:hypothetical protein
MFYTVGRELFVVIQDVRQFLIYDIYQRVKRFPRRYPYFDIVVGLAVENDPESGAGGSLPCLTCRR